MPQIHCKNDSELFLKGRSFFETHFWSSPSSLVSAVLFSSIAFLTFFFSWIRNKNKYRHLLWCKLRLKSPNSCDVTKRAIIDGNSIVSWQNYYILTSIIAKFTSRPFGDLNPNCYRTVEVFDSKSEERL